MIGERLVVVVVEMDEQSIGPVRGNAACFQIGGLVVFVLTLRQRRPHMAGDT